MTDEHTRYVESTAYELVEGEDEARRCNATTIRDRRCRRWALADSDYCIAHQDLSPHNDVLPVLREPSRNGTVNGPPAMGDAAIEEAPLFWLHPKVRKHVPIFILCAVILALGVLATDRGGGSGTLDGISNDSVAFWSVLDPSRVFVDAIEGPAHERALHVQVRPRRSYFTILSHDFKPPADLSARPYLSLNFRGQGKGHVYQFIVSFRSDNSAFALYQIRDYQRGWRQISFDSNSPNGAKGKPDWKHVTGLSLAAADKKAGDFALGAIGAATRADIRR
jgi:hypothetical protein